MWLAEPFTKGQAWIDLFANANHKEGTFWVRGTPIRVGRGQIAWSKLTMSDRWGWSEGKVDRFLEYLKTEEQIGVQTSSKTTLITILNYELYQADSRTDNRANGERTENRQGTNKNEENEKKTGTTFVVTTETEGRARKVTPEMQQVFDLFKHNPARLVWKTRVHIREAAQVLYDTFGIEELKLRYKISQEHKGEDMCPQIDDPSEFLEKMPKMENFLKKL